MLTGLALLAAGCSAPPDAQTLIKDSLAAMGSADLKTVTFVGEGVEGCVGQGWSPSGGWRKFSNKAYTRSVDLNARAWRMQRIRGEGEDPPRGGCSAGVVTEATQTQIVRLADDSPWAQQLDFIMLPPQGFLKVAASQAAVSSSEDGMNVVSFKGGNGAEVKGFLDDKGMLVKVSTQISESMLGTIDYVTEYSDYREFSGIKFPGHIVQTEAGHPTLDLTISTVEVNPQLEQGIAKGKSARPAAAPAPQDPPEQISEQLGDGVYLVTNGYAALLVEMDEYVMVVEAGPTEERAAQVLAEAKRLFPEKPVRYVINTHHHHDHAAGLRAYVAAGITILTHEANQQYLQNALDNANTLEPGKLEKAGMPGATIQTFGDSKEFSDGKHELVIYRVQNSMHAEGMAMIWLPKQRILFEADEFNLFGRPISATPPPDQINPYHPNLVDNIERLKLDVDRIIPVHLPGDGHKVTMRELRMYAGR